MAQERFAGQVAVVTGGVSGIGFAVCQRLVAEGARLAIWDVNAAALAEASGRLGTQVHTEALDLTDAAAVQAAADATAKALGKIDILVASAGITGPNKPVAEYPVEEWKRVMDVNVNGVFYCDRAVVPHMMAGGYGRIVNIASIAGKEGMPNIAPYSAAKAGVIGYTKAVAKELARTGITINAVAPVITETELFREMTQAHIDGAKARIPMGRFLTIPEIAAEVAFIASRECSFTTGAVFDISGGRATY